MACQSTFPTITALVQNISTGDINGDSKLITERFAVEYGTLSSSVLLSMPEATQVAIGISSKTLMKLGPDKSWQSVLQNAMNNPSLQGVDSEDLYHHSEHKTSVKNWFQKDGHLSKSGLR